MRVVAAVAMLVAATSSAMAETSRAEIEAMLKRYNETAINAHRFDRFAEFYHDPVVYNGVRMSLDDFVKAMTEASIGMAPDMHWHIQGYLIDGDNLAVRYLDTGTLVKPYRDVKPTGRPFSFAEHDFYHLRDGKFDEVWSVYDFETFRDQIEGSR
jgi:predicted ester cyclase